MAWRFLDHRFALPDPLEVPNWFDYATLIIGTSHTFDESTITTDLDRRLDGNGPIPPVIGLVHEHAHFVQTIATPYLFKWSTRWRERCVDLFSDLIPVLDGGLGVALDSELAENAVELARPLVRPFMMPGKGNLSVAHLIEAHAVFVEARSHTDIEDPESFHYYLDKLSPGPRYRRAYDITRLWCGDDVAYHIFHGLILASLCFSDPTDAFETILRRAARTKVDELFAFQRSLAACWAHGLNDISADIQRNELPDFWRYSTRFLHWVNQVGPEEFVREPRVISRLDLAPTIVFAADSENRFAVRRGTLDEKFGDFEQDDPGSAAITWEYTLAAMSQWLLRRLSETDEFVYALEQPRHDWLDNVGYQDFELHIPLDNWGGNTTSPTELVTEAIMRDVDRVCTVVTQNAQGNAPFPFSLVRRLRLSFVTDRREEVWQIPEVQTFISLLNSRLPWFPLLLRYDTPEDCLIIWFGSLAPAAVDGASINTSHPDAIAAIRDFFDAAQRIEESAGVDLGSLVPPIFGPITDLKQ